jgi:glycosyltransferase involved in cell wall biosynthesis
MVVALPNAVRPALSPVSDVDAGALGRLAMRDSVVPASRMKAVVAMAGSRDYYQLPLALSEGGALEALVTDMYAPSHDSLRRGFNRLVATIGIEPRFCVGLDPRTVRVPARALMMSMALRVRPGMRRTAALDSFLGQEGRRRAMRAGSSLFCYSYYASRAFALGADRPSHRFIFQVHPHPQAVRTILTEEIELTPAASASLRAEYEVGAPSDLFEALAAEPHLANGWTAASSFTARTLADAGIPIERIHVVPYGVDHRVFWTRPDPPRRTKPFTIIFVGSLIQRKGLGYLLQAVRTLSRHYQIRTVLCGRGFSDDALLSSFNDLGVEIMRGLPRERLIRELHSADVFVLPSLAEGFGHVILEAMACGVPIIATPHTAAPDLITDGRHGFIVPIRSTEALTEKLAWAAENREAVAAMGAAAALRSHDFGWDRFRSGIRQAYGEMLAAV